MLEDLQKLLSRAAEAAVVAEVVQRHCSVEHVALVAFDGPNATVLAAAGPDLLSAGTTAPATVSTRLVCVRTGATWRSSDLTQESAFDRPIDQLALALGLRAGAAVPLTADGAVVGAVLLSSTVKGRSWESDAQRLDAASGLLALALRLVREPGERLKVVLLHGDRVIANGLARLVERGLPADVELAAGCWDPRLPDLFENADAVVVDAALVDATASGTHGRTVVVVDRLEDRQPDSLVVELRAAADALVPTVARAVGRAAATWNFTQDILTPRERELLEALVSGRSYRQIAESLRLSESTVRGYSRTLYAKLGVHSRGEAVHKAAQARLIGT